MTVYWITFRLAAGTVGGVTYDDRYSALVKAVQKHQADEWWFEPTSFWLLRSASTRAQIAASIKAAIAPSKDLALIGSMEHTNATLVGKADDLVALKDLIPSLTIA